MRFWSLVYSMRKVEVPAMLHPPGHDRPTTLLVQKAAVEVIPLYRLLVDVEVLFNPLPNIDPEPCALDWVCVQPFQSLLPFLGCMFDE